MTDRHADDLDRHVLSPDRPPAWWGVTPAATPRPGWADRRPRRADWADVLEPDPFDPAGPWRRAAVWLVAVPLGAFVASYALLVVFMRLRGEPVYSLIRALERGVGDWAALSPCAIPAAAAGCIWIVRRGRGGPAARRAAAVYAGGVAWLYASGAAAVSLLGQWF